MNIQQMLARRGKTATQPPVRRGRIRRTVIVAAAMLALLGGGALALSDQDMSARNRSRTDDLAARTPATPVGGQLDTPVGVQLTWVLNVLNRDGGVLSEDDVTAHAAPAILAILPPEQLTAAFQQLAGVGPFTLQGFTRPPTATQAVALLASAGGVPFVLPMTVEAAGSHRITGLNLTPVPPPTGVMLAPAMPGADPSRFDGLVDIGGRQLYLSCTGTGSPTVVLEAGLGDSAAPWFAVERAVADFTRVCSYDRANAPAGASDPAPAPRTGRQDAADLQALLHTAGIPGPYVLVGHSIGAHIVRLYAAAYPAEVAGMVLVDAAHEEQDVRRQSLVEPELWAMAHDAVTLNAEGLDLDVTAAQVRAARAAAPLPAMPLVVVTAGVADPSFFPPGWPMEAEGRLHRELQADLTTLVPSAHQIIAERSGHYVHQSAPGLVVDAIREVVRGTTP
jgi:pimeloyl-ACP methyl ester carboxylesterase